VWQVIKKWLSSSKFVLTAGSLIATFALVAIGRDVRQLELIVPAILAFYNAANIAGDMARRKLGEFKDGTVDSDSSNNSSGG